MIEDNEKLGKLQDYFSTYKALPSYSYMSEKFKFGAKDSVFRLVAKLKEEQFLDVAPDKKLIPGKRFFDLPISNESVQAGAFANSYAQDGEFRSVEDMLIRKPSITKMMPVQGNSMINKGILDGDIAIYEQRPFAKLGEIVIAMLNNDYTIKELGNENGMFILIPHNDNFEIIRPKKPFEILGVVTGTFRTY